MIVVGIDNGLSGGLCAVNAETDKIVSYMAMPTYKEGDKTEIDVNKVIKFIERFSMDKILVAIEEPLKHAKSSQAVRSMAISFGKCVGACDALYILTRRIQVKDWQDAILGKGIAKGNTKVTALKRANDLWPEQSWLATPKSKVAHDGIVDAALIAYYTISINTP
jgi:hypothetical protein